jgi:hypothetical protein
MRLALLLIAIAAVAACSSSSSATTPVEAGSNEAGHAMEAGQDVVQDSGPSIEASAGSCFAAVGSNGPDAATALIYGSCIPHIADAAIPVCYESGHVGDIPDSGGVPMSLEMTCTSSPVNGTWSSARPCDRANVVFGCQEATIVGDVCATVTTTWYYPPATGADEVDDCPAPFVVVGP